VDDYSCFVWLYLLYHKSEVFDNFVKFKLQVENQFSTSIKQLQPDGGGEYMSLQFQTFLKRYGIIHHKSPQNGLAERKLRHILETGLSLLVHCNLSNRFWVDAFLTSVYIINQLPTPTLDNLSPFAKLFNKERDYHRLCVFGCRYYPLLRPYNLQKLDYRPKPYLFLGYTHTRYKCLDPLTNKVYLSRHVVFNKNTFLAKDNVVFTLPSQISANKDTLFLVPISPLFDFSFPPNDTCVSYGTNPIAANDVIPTSSHDLPIIDLPSPVSNLASPPPTHDSAITSSC
jgi:hypothetical protein